MRKGSEVFLDSDVFSEHLTEGSGKSVLLECVEKYDHCYTSVINIAEVFSACRTKAQSDAARRSFYGIGLLGIPYRYSEKLGLILKKTMKSKTFSYRDSMILMMCSETKLPLFSLDLKRYATHSRDFGVRLVTRPDRERNIK